MNTTNDSGTIGLESCASFRHTLIFGILTPILILSVLCYIYIFIKFAWKRRLCRVYNHSILIILIASFLQVISEEPLTLAYLYNNISLIQSDRFCKFWSAQDFVLGGIILMLMSYSSIERYLLIFHRSFIFRHLIILHHLPIIICIVYPFLFYVGMIYIYPCVNYFDYTMNTCGGPCYVFDAVPSTFDLIVNLALIEMMGILMNIILVSRVFYKKHQMKQQNKWKKNRRLLIQVLSITFLHNIMLFFMVSFMLIELFSPTPQPVLLDLTFNILQYGVYLVHLLCPFVTLVGLPKLWPHSILRFLRSLLTGNIVQPTIHIPINMNRIVPQQFARPIKHSSTK